MENNEDEEGDDRANRSANVHRVPPPPGRFGIVSVRTESRRIVSGRVLLVSVRRTGVSGALPSAAALRRSAARAPAARAPPPALAGSLSAPSGGPAIALCS